MIYEGSNLTRVRWPFDLHQKVRTWLRQRHLTPEENTLATKGASVDLDRAEQEQLEAKTFVYLDQYGKLRGDPLIVQSAVSGLSQYCGAKTRNCSTMYSIGTPASDGGGKGRGVKKLMGEDREPQSSVAAEVSTWGIISPDPWQKCDGGGSTSPLLTPGATPELLSPGIVGRLSKV